MIPLTIRCNIWKLVEWSCKTNVDAKKQLSNELIIDINIIMRIHARNFARSKH